MSMKIEIKITGPVAVGKTHFARRLEAWLATQELPSGTNVRCVSSNAANRLDRGELEFEFTQ